LSSDTEYDAIHVILELVVIFLNDCE